TDDPRAHVLAPVVQLLLQLILHDLALLFDDEDLLEARGELAHALGLERPRHRHLEKTNSDIARFPLVDAQFFERLAHVEIRLARCDDSEARIRRIDNRVVELVGARIGERGVNLVILHQRFLLDPLPAYGAAVQARVQAAGRHNEVLGQFDPQAERIGLHRGARFDGIRQRLETDEAAGVARHGPPVQTEIEIFLNVAGIEHRNDAGGEQMIALVRKRRGIGGMIIAGDEQHAAMPGASGVVRVLERVPAAIDAGTFAVPHREDAVVLRGAEQVHLLRPPHRGGGEVLVHARLELDVMRAQMRFGFPQRLVQPAERRTAIAGHEARGVESGGGIALALHDKQTYQRLNSADVNPAAGEYVFIVETGVGQCSVHARLRDSESTGRLSISRKPPFRRPGPKVRSTSPRRVSGPGEYRSELSSAREAFQNRTDESVLFEDGGRVYSPEAQVGHADDFHRVGAARFRERLADGQDHEIVVAYGAAAAQLIDRLLHDHRRIAALLLERDRKHAAVERDFQLRLR